jgi:hypothetical protein
MTALTDALDARFTDLDECKDVANFGCEGGVSGFIYSTELSEFYDEYEGEIEDILDACGIKLHELVDTDEFYSIQDLKEKSVWFVVEHYCAQRVEALVAA